MTARLAWLEAETFFGRIGFLGAAPVDEAGSGILRPLVREGAGGGPRFEAVFRDG
ncbi:MAG: hypothetical protein ACUVS7_19635 [Bryobacteraceae bacterium]